MSKEQARRDARGLALVALTELVQARLEAVGRPGWFTARQVADQISCLTYPQVSGHLVALNRDGKILAKRIERVSVYSLRETDWAVVQGGADAPAPAAAEGAPAGPVGAGGYRTAVKVSDLRLHGVVRRGSGQ